LTADTTACSSYVLSRAWLHGQSKRLPGMTLLNQEALPLSMVLPPLQEPSMVEKSGALELVCLRRVTVQGRSFMQKVQRSTDEEVYYDKDVAEVAAFPEGVIEGDGEEHGTLGASGQCVHALVDKGEGDDELEYRKAGVLNATPEHHDGEAVVQLALGVVPMEVADANEDDDAAIVPEGMWACVKCSLHNRKKWSRCQLCGNRMPAVPKKAEAVVTATVGDADEVEQDPNVSIREAGGQEAQQITDAFGRALRPKLSGQQREAMRLGAPGWRTDFAGCVASAGFTVSYASSRPGPRSLAARALHEVAAAAGLDPSAEAEGHVGEGAAAAVGSPPNEVIEGREGRGARTRRPPSWSREPPQDLVPKRWASTNGVPLGRRKVAGSSTWHASHLDPDQIWHAHRVHYRRIKQHARAQFWTALARHRPRLLMLLATRHQH